MTGGIAIGVSQIGKIDLYASYGGLFGIEGARAYVDLEYVHGHSFSTYYVGDFQAVSNIDAVPALRPFEAWVSVPFKLAGGDATANVG